MNYELEFQLPILPPTTNALSGKHWTERHRLNKQIKTLVSFAVGHRKPPAPLTQAELTLTRVSSQKPDYDGLVSSFKSVIDGLIYAGVLADDRLANIGVPQYRHEVQTKGFIRVRVVG